MLCIPAQYRIEMPIKFLSTVIALTVNIAMSCCQQPDFDIFVFIYSNDFHIFLYYLIRWKLDDVAAAGNHTTYMKISYFLNISFLTNLALLW